MTTATAPTSTTTDTGVEIKVGDFFSSSWGYDQTNVDFYKVVGLTASGKSVRVQKWTNKVASSTGPQDYVVPGDSPATYIDWSGVTQDMDYWEQQAAKVEREVPVVTKRLSTGYRGGAYFSVNSYSSASLWDGKPEYQTGSGWGH